MNLVKNKKRPILTPAFIAVLLICMLATYVISRCIFGMAIVVGPSMEPTLKSGGVVFMNKVTNNINRYDIVVVQISGKMIIKRVFGTPGETIQIKNGEIYINERRVKDVVNIETEFAGLAYDPILLGENEYFVLGDNRPVSQDSRYKNVGVIKEDQIIGKVVFR